MPLDHHLATYGTLAPGRPNHHQLSDLKGHWLTGTVRGRLSPRGWGAALGYPALVPDENGDQVDVWVFVSADLPQHWRRLDAFEGDEYQRGRIVVETANGPLEAWIYLDANP